MSTHRLRKLADNVYFVEGEGNGRFPSCHGFLFTGFETVLIDAGMGDDRIRAIDQDKRIDTLIISHSHPDHIRYWHVLKDRRILLPKETPDTVKDLQLLGERFTGTAERGAYWAKLVRNSFGVRPLPDADDTYEDGDVLEIGGAELQAIRADGHIRDHYCFLERKSGTLMTTDIDLTAFGPWYGNPESDIETFANSVRKVMGLSYNRVCSSHRLPIEGDATRHFVTFLGGFTRHRKAVLTLCKTPSTLEEIAAVSPFYGNGLPDKTIQRMFERNMVEKNLALLMRDGLVEESHGRFRSAVSPELGPDVP